MGCQDHKINFFIENSKNVAYDLLIWTEEKYADDAKMWKTILEALATLEKNRTIKNLSLEQRLAVAQEKNLVIICHS